MADTWKDRIDALSNSSRDERAAALAQMSASALAALADGELADDDRAALVEALLGVVRDGGGEARERMVVGEMLGLLGDPRLRVPTDADYWARLTLKSGDEFEIGTYQVTNDAYRAWVDEGGYEDRDAWSDEGWAWLEQTDDPWPELAARDSAAPFLIPNQPVVGVTWYEADAYARAHGARLPRWYERVFAVRGLEKRPYPWGDPFGEGNANTKEEVLGRPCAVGLYLRDTTPEGVHDLAGNAGEWTAEQAGLEYLLHPGSWDQPSLAAWAKALTTEKPTARWPALGFRLARD